MAEPAGVDFDATGFSEDELSRSGDGSDEERAAEEGVEERGCVECEIGEATQSRGVADGTSGGVRNDTGQAVGALNIDGADEEPLALGFSSRSDERSYCSWQAAHAGAQQYARRRGYCLSIQDSNKNKRTKDLISKRAGCTACGRSKYSGDTLGVRKALW